MLGHIPPLGETPGDMNVIDPVKFLWSFHARQNLVDVFANFMPLHNKVMGVFFCIMPISQN